MQHAPIKCHDKKERPVTFEAEEAIQRYPTKMVRRIISQVFIVVTLCMTASALRYDVESRDNTCTILRNDVDIHVPVILYGKGCRCCCKDCKGDNSDNNRGDDGNTDKPPSTSSTEPTKPPVITPPPLCLSDTQGETWRVRHETDCQAYYNCTDRKRVLQRCDDGQLFDTDLEVCDLAVNVDCTDRDHYS